jgi:hypothetical protein
MIGFDVLTATSECAQMTPIETVLASGLKPLVTGHDSTGAPLYSCAGRETSVVAGAPVSQPLGRYDVARNDCFYEWHNATHSSSVHGAGVSFDVLTER